MNAGKRRPNPETGFYEDEPWMYEPDPRPRPPAPQPEPPKAVGS
jgi:hypothetical protein